MADLDISPPSSSCTFDCLPDEVIVRILALVGSFDAAAIPGAQGSYARQYLRATTCCKRWLRLRYQIKDLDWTLETLPQAVALVNFLQHEQVSLRRLNLFATPTTSHLPFDLVFTDLVRRKVPPSVGVCCIQGDSADYRRAVDLTALVKCLLRCPHITELELSAEHYEGQEVSGLSPTELVGPLPPLKVLEVKDLWWQLNDLEGVITRCSFLEHLEVSLPMTFADDFEPNSQWNLNITSASIKSAHIVCNAVSMEAPRLTILTLGVQKFTLSTPALTDLTIDTSCLRLGMPDGLPEVLELPKLQKLSVANIEGLPGWWDDLFKPIMEAFSQLDLEALILSSHEDILAANELQPITLKELMHSLPPNLRTLGLEGHFLKLVNASQLASVERWPRQLQVLKAHLWDVGTGYFWVRVLAKFLSSLQKIDVTCLEWFENEVVEVIRTDFASAPCQFILYRRILYCSC